MLCPNAAHVAPWPDAAARMALYATFVDHVRPAFERLVAEGLVGAWGLTGIGHPDMIIKLLGERPAPAARAMHRQTARFAGRVEVLQGTGKPSEGLRDGPCQRGWCDGHPGNSSRCADERNRSAAAGRPS